MSIGAINKMSFLNNDMCHLGLDAIIIWECTDRVEYMQRRIISTRKELKISRLKREYLTEKWKLP